MKKSIQCLCPDCNPQPMTLRIDGVETDALTFLPIYGGLIGILERLRWEIVEQPEPSISYYAIHLLEALEMGASFAFAVDEANNIGYMTPIHYILDQGELSGSGPRTKVQLPLRYWDVVFDNNSFESSRSQEAS